MAGDTDIEDAMTTGPAIPALVVIPGEQNDYHAIYAMGTAYAHSGLMLNSHAKKTERPELAFPSMVCSSFAIELFMKFFIALDNADNPSRSATPLYGHTLLDLWQKIAPVHQQLVAGMFRNPSGAPRTAGLGRCRELFINALSAIGKAPFVDWRYPYEIGEPKLMSQAAITEVLDALGYAAEYLVKSRRVAQ